MDFALSAEQAAMFDMARGFAVTKMAPFAQDWEDAKALPRDVLSELAGLGMAAICVGDDYGSGLGRQDCVLVFEALGYGDPSVSAFLSIHNLVAGMIDRHGSAAQRARFLPGLAAMRQIGSYCLTEPGSGSDAAALRTTARRDGDDLVLDGSKAFISGAGTADVYVVMCRTGGPGPRGISAVLVEKDAPGLSFGAQERKMGWMAQPTAEVRFDGCRVPAENLLGTEGQGFVYAMQGLDGGRLNIAACALGAAQATLDKSVRYLRERQAFGGPLSDLQALRFRLADMETALQASRVFLRQAAWKLDTSAADATTFCAMAKRFVTDAAFEVANQALQLHGGYGYLTDFGIEKIVRDLRVHQILEGSNEIMRLITARALLGEG